MARTDLKRGSRDRRMTESELTGFLTRKIHYAMNGEDGDLSEERKNLFDRYFGQLYGSERDGYSQFTTREVLEAVEWAKPALLKVFLGSDKIVSFDAVGPEDEDRAAQETDVVNYKVLKANDGDGFMSIYNFIHDALLYPTGYIKTFIEEEEKTTTHKVTDVMAEGLPSLIEDPEIEITEQNSRIVTLDVPMPNPQDPAQVQVVPQQVEVFDLTYKQTKKERKLRLMALPGEETLVDSTLTELNLDKADFVCHRARKTYSELVRMGYDKKKLDSAGGNDELRWNDERTNRLFYEDENAASQSDDDYSMRSFWVHECYAWVDYDGTGQAQYRRIVLIGKDIFENEEVDYQPMVAMSTVPIPHKHNGLSLAQLVESYQKLITTLTRAMLDNIYVSNNLRQFVSENSFLEDGTTMDAMLNRAAQYIPVRGLATEAAALEPYQSIIGEILPAIQHSQQAVSMRSGVAPQNNVDPAVVQQANTGAFMGALEQATERIEMIARIFAETGIKQLFRKVHQLCRMYPDIVTTVKLRGEWVPVDAAAWDERTDVTAKVGLGFKSKQQIQELLINLLQIQRESMDSGLTTPKELFKTLEDYINAAELGSPERYFIDPESPKYQPPQPQPDPQAILAQAQAEALTQEQQRKMQEFQHSAQMDMVKMQAEQMKIQAAGEKAQADTTKAKADAQLKVLDFEAKREEREQRQKQIENETAKTDADIDNTDADTDLKDAQTLKTLAEAGTVGDEPEGGNDESA